MVVRGQEVKQGLFLLIRGFYNAYSAKEQKEDIL